MHLRKNFIATLSLFILMGFAVPVSAQMPVGLSSDMVLPDTAPTVPAIQAMPEAEIIPDVRKLRKTHPERILFTHYKLARSRPDLAHFSRSSPLVQKAQDIDKAAMTMSEHNRMENAFNLHDEKAPFVIHTSLAVDEYSSLQDLLAFDELNDKTFFRIPFYGEEIAIVPKDVNRFARIKISKPRADAMFKALSGGKAVQAEFILKPVFADRKEPFVLEDETFWLMLADIAELRLWAGDELVWYYRADWYKPEDKTNLGKLYTE